jgi:rod shape determining protein RodA
MLVEGPLLPGATPMVDQYFPERKMTATEKLWQVPWTVMLMVALIAAVGATALYSVAGGRTEVWAEAHVLRFLVAAAFVLMMAQVPTRLWIKVAYPAYAIALALLILVPLFGTQALGAKRWLSIGGFSLQPSELMKVGVVLGLARYYQSISQQDVSQLKRVVVPLAMIFVPIIFTLRQPDLGSATLFAALGLALVFLAGVSTVYFAVGGAAVLAALPYFWTTMHEYQRRRVEIFLDPDKDPLGAGYHITQSKIALGSGGLSGKGFMQGTQSQLDFLPEKQTDFIFTMFSEEWGFVGALVLLSLYAVLLSLLLAMALRARNQFSRLVIAGSAVTIFIYIFINVAMVTGMVPVVGVPLPFVSYGGTALTTLMVGLGLAIAADVHRNEPLEAPSNRLRPATGERMAGILGVVPKRVLDRVRRG